MTKKGIERGQSITFRVPSDTPDYLLKQLAKLKENERRNFSSTIASFVLKGVNESYSKERETVTIPLPRKLTKEQKSWLKHEHSEALIGTILYELLTDPMRATTLFASLTNNQELSFAHQEAVTEEPVPSSTTPSIDDLADLDDMDIDMLDFEKPEEEEETEEIDPLGDFFSSMNK